MFSEGYSVYLSLVSLPKSSKENVYQIRVLSLALENWSSMTVVW